MSVKISSVAEGSRAAALGIEPGDVLISLNGNEIIDILDFRFYETNRELEIVIEDQNGERHTLHTRKGQYESLGMDFDSFLIDSEHSCRNKCIFCFVDQLPKGMRKSLYFKDDDDRLSFLFGNYVTLTNMSEAEIKRLIKMHISPINVSVHTMNPELRCKIMHNRFAGDVLRYIPMLTEAGIKLNCQLVLCPGINDGEELIYTVEELLKLGENIQSLACVPIGMTRYRDGLEHIDPYTKERASEVIDVLEHYGDIFKERYGARTCYASDEFYIIAERELPPVEFYEDFSQIENGVGMIRNLEDEFEWAMEDMEDMNPEAFDCNRKVAMISGEAVHPFMLNLVEKVRARCKNMQIDLFKIKNNFFGGNINITGLITGTDIFDQLKDLSGYDEFLIPTEMVKADEDILLDDVSLEEISEKLHVKVRKSGTTGDSILKSILGLEDVQGARHYYYQTVD